MSWAYVRQVSCFDVFLEFKYVLFCAQCYCFPEVKLLEKSWLEFPQCLNKGYRLCCQWSHLRVRQALEHIYRIPLLPRLNMKKMSSDGNLVDTTQRERWKEWMTIAKLFYMGKYRPQYSSPHRHHHIERKCCTAGEISGGGLLRAASEDYFCFFVSQTKITCHRCW